ncbi:MAG: peptidoglycan binding protein CsiV [Gammaproteobacteria bacterium]|nr:peptidoglycan binding protein CsiV [Gammaproteobacteria bacterium]
MFETVRKSKLLLLATLLPALATAQDELLDEEPAEIRLYSVEVIVFTYADGGSPGSEIFLPDPIEPAPDEAGLIGELAVVPLQRRDPGYVDNAPILLPEDQLSMRDVFEKLQRLDAYEPLLHFGWTQPGLPQDETVAVPLSALGQLPAGLEGSFTLYLGRYLHLVVDLALTEPATAAEYVDQSGAIREFEYSLPPLDGPVRFRIREDRILKSGDIRYFDHPKFGVVAKLLRVESVNQQASQEITR